MNKIKDLLTLMIVTFILTILVFNFSILFVSWGHQRPWYLKVLFFIINFPFSVVDKNNNVNLFFVPINLFLWTSLVFFLLKIFRGYSRNKSK